MAKIVRDPVHGDIQLTPLQKKCLDTPQMQRLRGIRQLGTAYLVYPGAQHTRFEHSLGTLHVAGRILDCIEDAGIVVQPEHREMIGVAALLHDVGHLPYGHTLEDERRVFPRHDDDKDRWTHFLESKELGGVLKKSGLKKTVTSCLTGKAGAGEVPKFAIQVVRDTVCADLLDYLRRDAYFCGLSQHYDDRVFQYFRQEKGTLFFELIKNGLFRHDALTEIINLLRLRYTLSERVYYHHTKIASGAMISKAVELGLTKGLKKADLYGLKDESLLYVLRTRFSRVRGIRTLMQRLDARRLYKAAYLLSPAIGPDRQADLVSRYHLNEGGEREKIERRIARKLAVPPESVIIYCPAVGMALKEADVLVRTDAADLVSLATLRNPEIEILKEKHRQLWKFYVFVDPEQKQLVSRAPDLCQEQFGIPSELPRARRGHTVLKPAPQDGR